MKDPIRILHIVTIMDLGGIETFLMTLYRSINKTKIQFDFLVHRNEKGYFDDEIRSLGGKVHKISALNPLTYFSYRKEFKTFLKQNHYHIVHSHLNANSSIVLQIAKSLGVSETIAHSHIDKSTRGVKGLMKNISKKFINRFAKYKFACSNQAGIWLYGKKSNFKVLNNAIDSSKFIYNQPRRLEIRESLGVKLDDIVLGNIARFNFQKNHDFIIDTFSHFNKNHPKSKLLLLGDGELFQTIRDKVEEYGLNDTVIFTGAVGNANEYLNAMDAFLFPSLFEGLGIVAIEAQTNGLPVIMNESLPSELDVTELTFRLSLNDSKEKWVENIEIAINKNRVDRQQDIKRKGYDVAENIKFLESFYLGLH